jgi:hypothetical protein
MGALEFVKNLKISPSKPYSVLKKYNNADLHKDANWKNNYVGCGTI